MKNQLIESKVRAVLYETTISIDMKSKGFTLLFTSPRALDDLFQAPPRRPSDSLWMVPLPETFEALS